MKAKLIKYGIYGILLAIIFALGARSCKLSEELEQRDTYISQYETQVAGKDKQIQELQMTYNQLRSSHDTLNIKFDSICKELKIKPSKVTRIEYVDRVLNIYDTIKLKDTLFVRSFDTALVYNDLTKFQLSFIEPDSFTFNPSIQSKMYVITHIKKEYVNPPSKVFFIRWFQKKRKVSVVDITEENELIHLEQSRFVNIIDK